MYRNKAEMEVCIEIILLYRAIAEMIDKKTTLHVFHKQQMYIRAVFLPFLHRPFNTWLMAIIIKNFIMHYKVIPS